MRPVVVLLASMLLAPTLATAAPESCGGFGEPKTSAGLLDGRLSILVPADAALVANRPRNLMGPSEGDENRSEIRVENGGDRLRIVAAELFARRGTLRDDELAAAIGRLIDIPADALVPFAVSPAAPLRMVAVAPDAPRALENQTTVFSAIVEDADGFLLFVGMSLDGDGVSLAQCAGFVHAIANSVAAGSRRLATDAGWRRLGEVAGNGPVEVELPAGWAVRAQAGPDFDVWYLTQVGQLGAASPAIGVYAGGHPSFAPSGKPSRRGRVLGERIDWYEQGGATNGLARFGDLDVVHVWFDAASDDDAARFRAIVEGMRTAQP